MSDVHVYTSCNYYYLDRAKVLATSLKRHNPDYTFWLLLTDYPDDVYSHDWSAEPFDKVFWSTDLPVQNVNQWMFKHDVVELCTAVKGPFLEYLLAQGCEKVIYLDPDIAVFDSLGSIEKLLDTYSIVLTPHQLEPESKHEVFAIQDNELCSSLHGVFNLGFVAVKNNKQGNQFATWWSDRLQAFCFDEKDKGIFVDQKLCDLAPCYFSELYILRDYGCNVASWNLGHRKIKITDEGTILVKNDTLKFYHFTKLGPIGDIMTERYAKDNVEVYELWAWYKRKVIEFKDERLPKTWYYGYYANGEKVTNEARILYRHRKDLQNYFTDPYSTEKDGGYYQWFLVNA